MDKADIVDITINTLSGSLFTAGLTAGFMGHRITCVTCLVAGGAARASFTLGYLGTMILVDRLGSEKLKNYNKILSFGVGTISFTAVPLLLNTSVAIVALAAVASLIPNMIFLTFLEKGFVRN